MRIVELTALQVHIPLRKPIQHASHTRTSTENIVVRCVLEDGTEGFGEGVPREYVTGETIDSALELLTQSHLPEQLQPCHDFSQAMALGERLRLADVPGDDRKCHGNAARCAVELAVLDAYGKTFGQTPSNITQQLAPELYQPQDRVQYSGAITSANGLKLHLAGVKYWLYGFAQMKVKVGIDGHNDVERLNIVRRRMGKNINLRIDANEAWSPANVVAKIHELEPFGITSVEQPVAHADVDCLSKVRQEVRTPIMLDESLCSMTDAERAREQGICDLFNLRLSKCGGFIPTLRLAQFARRHGLGWQLGCQVGESALLSAAGRHFASSVADIRYREGSYDRHLVKESLAAADITFGYGGWAPALVGPGLGITIDMTALERVTSRKEVLLG